MLLDSVMFAVMLILLGLGVAAVVWTIRNDENFRMWMNMAFVRYYNRAEELHDRLVRLAQKEE